jgi:preprotein translocase subunit SecE
MFTKLKLFLQEAKQELKKTSWTSREELVGSSVVVIVAVAVLAIFIGIIDFLLAHFINFMIK